MLLYPVNLNINDKLCLVIGGGAVALRKVNSLLDSGGVVRIISPELVPELMFLAGEQKVEWIERGFAEGDLQGAFLVFAATSSRSVQAQVMEEAKKYSALINSADDPRNSQFHVPAHFRRGQMLVTVATGGGSPALAKKLRQQLERDIEPEYADVVELLSRIREEVIRLDDDFISHRNLFKKLLQEGIVDLVLQAQWFDLQMMLLQELPEAVDSVSLMKKFLLKYDNSVS